MPPTNNGHATRNGQVVAPSDVRRKLRQMRRLFRLFTATITHTLYLSAAVRRRPLAERAVYRARHQEAGCRLLCRIMGIRVTVAGAFPEGPSPQGSGRLLVCNHIGLLDPIVLASQMPVSFAGKAEIARWPLLGWVTREMGVFSVERERRALAGAFVDQVQERLAQGVDVLVFPEGRTSRGPSVLPFKTGAFAAVAGAERGAVIPLYLRPRMVDGRPAVGADFEQVTWADSQQTFAEHVWHVLGLKCIHYEIRVGTPIATRGRDRKELTARAHQAVVALRTADVHAAR